MPKKTLTPKIQLFVDEFLKDFNGTQAAIRVGFSENCAVKIAYEYLRKPHMGVYGSPYSNQSATNPYATEALRLYDQQGAYRAN